MVRVAHRIPFASSGEKASFAEDAADDSAFSATARLAVDLLPNVGQAMGVRGRAA
jgi:hypothetical protein